MAEVNEGIPTKDHGSSNVVKKIRELQKQEFESGEVINTPTAIFRFPFLRDERYLKAPNSEAIRHLAGHENTVTHAQKAIKDLQIKNPVTITREIPNDDKKWFVIPSLGIGGRALSSAELELYFDPNHSNVVESLSTWSGRQIAHELTHIARFQANKGGNTLLDSMINEGLATYYEEHLDGKYIATKWGHALDQEQLQNEWQRAQNELESTDFNSRDWFFGLDKGHPLYSGYSLGTAIVSEYFRINPHKKMADAVRISSKKILRESRYRV